MRELLVAAAVLLVSSTALAQRSSDAVAPDARTLVSVGAGVAIALTSLGVGGVVLATNDTNAARKAGAYTILSGLVLAPIASHAIAGEWGRAAMFAAVPLAAAAGAAIVIERSPVLEGHGMLGQRRILTLCTSVAVLSAAVGLFDSMYAGERARARSFALAPWVGPGMAGAWVGGAL